MLETNTLSHQGYQYRYAITQGNPELVPLFFINGAFQNMHSWDGVITHLKGDRTIIIADLPGWGKADVLPSDYGFDFYADAIYKILRAESIQRIIPVSTSYGTPIALALAEQYREMVGGLILTAPILEINQSLLPNYPRMKEMIARRDLIELAHFLIEIGLLNQDAGESGCVHNYELIETCFIRQVANLSDHKLKCFQENTDRILRYNRQDMTSIKDIPALVFTGEHDSFTPPKECLKLASGFVSFHFETISKADHFFLFERPDKAAGLIMGFLETSKKLKVQAEACGSEVVSLSRS